MSEQEGHRQEAPAYERSLTQAELTTEADRIVTEGLIEQAQPKLLQQVSYDDTLGEKPVRIVTDGMSVAGNIYEIEIISTPGGDPFIVNLAKTGAGRFGNIGGGREVISAQIGLQEEPHFSFTRTDRNGAVLTHEANRVSTVDQVRGLLHEFRNARTTDARRALKPKPNRRIHQPPR
jgi:hypothetical protein